MRYTLLRNATALLEYGGKRFLIDPMLDPAGARAAVPNTPNARPNPQVDLPANAQEIIGQADTLLVTHLHQDHFDSSAANTLDHNLPVYGQPDDAQRLASHGFWDLHPVGTSLECDGITISRTRAHHGTGEIEVAMAPVSGFVLESTGEPTVYIASDTIWHPDVAAAIERFEPSVVVVNAGGARFLQGDPIVMTVSDVAQVCRAAPAAIVIVVHLEAINHCLEVREDYRNGLPALGVDMSRVRIPEDGETISVPVS